MIFTLKINFSSIYAGNYLRYLLLAALLFVILPIIAFIYPGIEKGIDLTGGTLIIVKTEKHVDPVFLEGILSKYELTELKIVPFSGGVQIHFGSSKKIDNASKILKDANNLFNSDPQQSLALCHSAFSQLSTLYKAEVPIDPKTCIEEGHKALVLSKESLKESISMDLIKSLELNESEAQRIQYTEIAPALGELFWRTAVSALIISCLVLFLLMFIFFREFIPVVAILQAAVFDVLCALAAYAVLKIPFSLTSLSAILMLIGYSIDTDIMLTAKVLKGTGKPRDNATLAMKTGLMMTGVSLITFAVMMIFSSIYSIDIIFSISVVLFYGLLGDIFSTWFVNAPLILWYTEKKMRQR
ncbi:MAG: hypothetical protein QXM75_02075 [Candidatus Diapherotrites archaeon]